MKPKTNKKLQYLLKAIKKILSGIIKIFTPDPTGWKSASIGIIIITLILILILVSLYVSRLGIVISGLFILYFSVIGIASALGFLIIFRLLKIIPDFYKWVIAGALPVFIFFWPAAPVGRLIIITVTILSASFIAGTTGILIKKGWKRKRPRNTILNVIFLIFGLTILLGFS